MAESIRRRRRTRRTDNSEVDISLITTTEPSSFTNTEAKSDDAPSSESQVTVDSTTTSHQAIIDRIRSEINEDQHHCSLNEPYYSNDTHDWGDHHENISSDYWHFLGQYE